MLDEKAMGKLGMNALLGVGAGLGRQTRLVVMRWRGATSKAKPDRLCRQGRLLRYRRHLHQARRRHGGHEGRHGRGGLRGRPDARARAPQGEGSTPSASSGWWRTCPAARPIDPATS